MPINTGIEPQENDPPADERTVTAPKKRVSRLLVTGAVTLSLSLVLFSFAIPELRLRAFISKLRQGGAVVVVVNETPPWIEKLTKGKFTLHMKIVGIQFGKYPATDQTLKEISHCPLLQRVSLEQADISEQALSELLSRCPKLNHLQLVSCPKISVGYVQKLKRSKVRLLAIEYRGVAYLGLSAWDLDSAQGYGDGCIVNRLQVGQSAHAAGIKRGDHLITFEGKTIKNFAALVDLIGEHQPGDEVAIKLIRNSEELTIRCILTAREHSQQ